MYLSKDKLLKRLKIILKIPTEVKTIIYKKPIPKVYFCHQSQPFKRRKNRKTLVKTIPFW